MSKLIALAIVVAALQVGGCASGNPQQHTDIIAQVNSINQPLNDCYQIALARNRKTPGGFLTVHMVAEAQTGQFKDVIVRRDEIQDPAVRMCVVQGLRALKLPKPPTTSVEIDYPIHFTPQQ